MPRAKLTSASFASNPPLVYPSGSSLAPGLVPDTVPMEPAALTDFMGILRNPTRYPSDPEWWLKVAFNDWNGRCAYCGGALSLDEGATLRGDAATLDLLVPQAVGGPHLHDAVVLCCGTCKAARAGEDWLTWRMAADRKSRKLLKDMRNRIGTTETFNHLAADPSKVWTKLQVERMLEARWAQPRFAVQASLSLGGCFLGVKDRTRPPAEFTAIVWANHGRAVDDGDSKPNARQAAFFFEHPRDCLAAIWQLVEVNAWVRRSDLRPVADFLPPVEDPALASWVFVSPNVGDLVRRDYKKPTGWKRHSKEWKSGKVSKGADGSWAVSA